MYYLLFQSLTFCNRIIYFLVCKTATDLYHGRFLKPYTWKNEILCNVLGLTGYWSCLLFIFL